MNGRRTFRKRCRSQDGIPYASKSPNACKTDHGQEQAATGRAEDWSEGPTQGRARLEHALVQSLQAEHDSTSKETQKKVAAMQVELGHPRKEMEGLQQHQAEQQAS